MNINNLNQCNDKNIQIIPFERENLEHKHAFLKLNVEWLEKYFIVEEIDKEILSHPEEYVLNRGGYILFAEFDNKNSRHYFTNKSRRR